MVILLKNNIFSITILIIMFFFLIPNSKGDKEPNNSFDHPEIIDDSRTNGKVYIGFLNDIDIYYIDSPNRGNIKITLKMASIGAIRMDFFDSTEIPHNEMVIEVDSLGEEKEVVWTNPQIHDGIYLMLKGSGEYTLKVEYTETQVDEDLSLTAIAIFAITIGIAIIIIVVAIIFFKVINIRTEKEKFSDLEFDMDIPEAERVDLLPDGIPDDIDETEIPPEAKLDINKESGLIHSIFE
jgi:hypothetical protein